MAWTPVPPEHHPIFHAALPKDPRILVTPLFGGLAAKVNNNFFAGLFGRSVILWLPEAQRPKVLALEGASMFDPMGDGRRSDKVQLPEAMMEEPADLKRWIARAFTEALKLPPKAAKKKAAKKKAAKVATRPTKAASRTKAAKELASTKTATRRDRR